MKDIKEERKKNVGYHINDNAVIDQLMTSAETRKVAIMELAKEKNMKKVLKTQDTKNAYIVTKPEQKMKLKDVKLAIFDFDDTLAIHKDKNYVEHRKKLGENNYFRKAFENPDTFYETIEPCDISKDMVNLICYLRLHNVKMYCLSGMRMSLHAEAKQHFINENYGEDIKLVSASTQEYKVDVVKILQESTGCKSNEILFIDDLQKVVDLMKEQGYMALLESQVKDITIDGTSLGMTLIEVIDD